MANKVAEGNNESDWDNCGYEWLIIRISGKCLKSWTIEIPIDESKSKQEQKLRDLKSNLVVNSSTISFSMVPITCFEIKENEQKLTDLSVLFNEVFSNIVNKTEFKVLGNKQFHNNLLIGAGKI